MEETKLSKTSSSKQNNLIDTNSLYQQCQTQLIKLNHHIAHQINTQRNAKLNSIIPSISSLNQQITLIQQSINHENTQEQNKHQRQRLLQQKQNLLTNMQSLSKKIEKYKKQLIVLNINQEELMHQFQENKRIIEEKERNFSSIHSPQKIENTKSNFIQRKTTLPSIFSQKSQRLETNRSQIYPSSNSKQSKWPKVDKLFDKLSNLKFTNLASILVDVAKRQNGSIKGVFRNFKTNQKIGQYAKSQQVRKQFDRLLKSIKNQNHN